MKNTASQANAPDFYYGWGVLNANKAISYQQKEVFPPLDFSIQNLENNFIFFFEYINRLTWKPNVRNTKQIRYYRLYKKPVNGNSQSFELVAQLDNNVTGFDIRGLKWNEVFLYKITAVDGSGKESDPNYTRGWEIIDLDLLMQSYVKYLHRYLL